MTTMIEQLQALIRRREELIVELRAVESELVDAGSILSVTLPNPELRRSRGRLYNGDSIRGRVLAIMADGSPHASRDVTRRVDARPDSVKAAISRMYSEGELERVEWGVYRLSTHGSALSATGGDPSAEPLESGERA